MIATESSRRPYAQSRRHRVSIRIVAFVAAAVWAANCTAQIADFSRPAQTEQGAPLYALPPPVTEPFGEVMRGEASDGRRHLLVRLPVPRELPDGNVYVEPDVQFIDAPPNFTSSAALGQPVPPWAADGLADGERVNGTPAWLYDVQPTPMQLPMGVAPMGRFPTCPHGDGCGCYSAAAEPLFGDTLAGLRESACDPCSPLGVVFNPANRSGDIGIGHDRLILAPFELDSSQPNNSTLFRVDLAYGFPHPDRSEYFWAAPANNPGVPGTYIPGRGPDHEWGVNYQDFRFRTEIGGERFSASTEIPLRSLDPAINPNTTGMGDMNVATKTVMLDGKTWQLTQVFRTYIMTGAASKGLGTGHVSLEPGVLATYRWRPTTFLHSELKYWFPIAGHPTHAGEVLRFGLGYSRLLYETDAFAVIHTGEFVGLWFLDGGKIVPPPPRPGGVAIPPPPPYAVMNVDNDPAYQFYPGLRFVADTGGDFGLIEFGVSGTFSMGDNSLFDSFLRFDCRISY